MTPRARLRRAWDSVRPRTRRGAFLSAAAIAGGAAVLSFVLLAGAAVAWNPYLSSFLDRGVNARQWAGLEMAYTESSTCRSCHEAQHARLIFATHQGIGCQSCHGALLQHSEDGKDASTDTVPIPVPTDEVCVKCHTAAVGRPAAVRQIVPRLHYVNECLECHDPHRGIANRPLVVLHPLSDLPPCLTCHGTEGFKARNQRHPEGDTDDARCMECHGAGRGPEDDDPDATPPPRPTPEPTATPKATP